MSQQTKNKTFLKLENEVFEITNEYIINIINKICVEMKINVDINKISNNVFGKLKHTNNYNDVITQIITTASDLMVLDNNYSVIAVYLLVNELHKNTDEDYYNVCIDLYNYINSNNVNSPIISEDFLNFVRDNRHEINSIINYQNDYNINIFGFRTLEKSYLKRLYNNKIIERPQHMFMRVSIAIHWRKNDMEKIKNTYNLMSNGYFTHATPTLFNSGTQREQLSSCFLFTTNDSIEGIGKTVNDSMVISKYAGGIGIGISNIRPMGSYINSTQGYASGLKAIKILNEASRYSDQGGRRAGSFAIYCEPWHADIEYFLDLKKNIGDENLRARDIFLGLMINDIFMERVRDDENWSLMDSNICKELVESYGEKFNKLYLEYESQGLFIKQIKARDLWFHILDSQIETGNPYILYKDACNEKSNHKNYGTIKISNLCAEILEYCDDKEYAVCNLASICLPKFIEYDGDKVSFNYEKLKDITMIITENLNNIIDINFYPLPECRRSNLIHRPIGIGVQGLADVFALMKTPFDSELAREVNRNIFETIYFGAMTKSMEIAKVDGYYESYLGSPISQGKFQFDLWGVKPQMWDWEKLREKIRIYGVRNSLTTACMPTASTSQIMGNNECIEPYTTNIYSRSTLAGIYYIINNHLMKDLEKIGLWNEGIIDLIKYYRGSIQKIKCIPDNIKELYRTVWEIPQKSLVQMSIDRAPYIDQSQSLNIFMRKPDYQKLTSCHFRTWESGLKTGMYYLRTRAATDAIQFGVDYSKIREIQDIDEDNIEYELPNINEQKIQVCEFKRFDDEECLVCSA